MRRTPDTATDQASDGSPTSAAAGPSSPERGGDEQPSAVEVTLGRLEDQIAWYDTRAQRCQRWFKRVKGAELVAAAVVPVIAMLGVAGYWTAAVGAGVVILQGIQQLNQFQQSWITYRSTCEQLKHEKYLFHAGAGPYANANQPARRLANRIEGLISQEHGKWVDNREDAAEQLQNAGAPA